jgi:hypothetical protein
MKRVLWRLTPVFLVLALGLTAGSAGAVTNIGNNWCIGNSSDCVNAWGGGPQVNVYTGGTTANGDFLATTDSNDTANYMLFTNIGAPYYDDCIGDNGNSQTSARAALVGCPGALGGNTAGDGWGTHMVPYVAPYCASGYTAWYDVHWQDWLGPVAGYGNGSAFYLNKQTPYCFRTYPPVG